MDIINLFLGNGPELDHGIVMFTVLALFLSLYYISSHFFSVEYDINQFDISDLGSLQLNPDGRMYYNIANILAGISMTPHFLYLHLRLNPQLYYISWIGLILGWLGCFSFAILSIFPIENKKPHMFFTYLSVVGLIGGYIYVGVMKINQLIYFEIYSVPNYVGIGLIFVQFIIYILYISRFFIKEIKNGGKIQIKAKNEWGLLMVGTFFVIGSFFIV